MAAIYYLFNYEKALDYLCDEIHGDIAFSVLGELFFISVFLIMPIWTFVILLPTFEKDLDNELEYDEEEYPTN